MLSLKKVFSAVVLGTAVMTATAHNCNADTIPAADYTAVETTTPEQAAFSPQNATVIGPSENAYDLSPAVRHIVTKVKDALAAKK